MNIRRVKEGILDQGVDERVVYTITTTPWGSGPATSTTVFKLYDTTDAPRTDVTATLSTGTASASGDVITLPTIHSLVGGHRYRVEVKFVCGANTFECYFEISASE